MKFVNYESYFLDELSVDLLKRCEFAGRTCYASRDKIIENSYEEFIRKVIKSGHESVLEHRMLSFFVKCDRATMAELTRHRHTAYSVQSTRYVNGNKHGLEFVIPHWMRRDDYTPETDYDLLTWSDASCDDYFIVLYWAEAMRRCSSTYSLLASNSFKPEDARGVLPNDLATEMVVSCNLRELRSILKLRTSKAAHPNIRRIFKKLLDDLRNSDIKVLVEDIDV